MRGFGGVQMNHRPLKLTIYINGGISKDWPCWFVLSYWWWLCTPWVVPCSAPTPKSIDSKCHSITRPVPFSGVACRDVCEFPLAQHSIALWWVVAVVGFDKHRFVESLLVQVLVWLIKRKQAHFYFELLQCLGTRDTSISTHFTGLGIMKRC